MHFALALAWFNADRDDMISTSLSLNSASGTTAFAAAPQPRGQRRPAAWPRSSSL
jgi:hypothetical protein